MIFLKDLDVKHTLGRHSAAYRHPLLQSGNSVPGPTAYCLDSIGSDVRWRPGKRQVILLFMKYDANSSETGFSLMAYQTKQYCGCLGWDGTISACPSHCGFVKHNLI